MAEKSEPVHPYCILGGGVDGQVHCRKKVVDRHIFLHALPEHERRYLHLDGFKVYYARLWGGEFRERRKDEVPPQEPLIRLLFIQGLAGVHTNWFPQIEFFVQDPRFDVVALDCRGVGYSDTPGGRWGTSDMANDVIALIQELKWDQCHMFGFSLGGMVALEAATHRPDLFKSVILISTHAGGLLGTVLPPWGIPPFIRTFSSIGSATAVDRGMELLHSMEYLNDDVEELTPDLAKAANQALGSNDRITNRFATAYELILQARKYVESMNEDEIRPPGILRQMGAAITHYVGWDRLFFLKVSGISFFVAAGMQDNLVNYMNGLLLANALEAPLILKKDAGHAVNLHYRKEVNDALLRHIEAAEVKKPVEGRRPLGPRDGFPPGRHPGVTLMMAFLPCLWIARRLAGPGTRRNLVLVALLSLVLRVTYGPLYKVSDLHEL